MGRLELKDTVELMCSADYRERFIGEYIQTKIRYERLKAFNNKIEAARRVMCSDEGVRVEEPKHDCPAGLLKEQQAAMGEYLHLLEVRAVIEDIDLADVEAWLEGKCDTSSVGHCPTPSPAGEGLRDEELKLSLEGYEDDWGIVAEAVAKVIEKGLCNDSDEEKLMAAALNVLHKVKMCDGQREESDLSTEEIKKGLENCVSKSNDCNNCPAGQALKDSCECGEYLMRQALGCIKKLEEAKDGKAKD